MNNEVLALKQIASDFRFALESLAPSIRPIGLENFPHRACGDTSLLLGAYLVDLGIHGFKYICGYRGSYSDGSRSSHAWLHRDGLIIDLTADQFDDGPGPVLVVQDSDWHRTFDWAEPSAADFRELYGVGTDGLPAALDAIKDAITPRPAVAE
jgi:hypothetical protein